MKQIQIGASHVNTLYKAMKMLERKSIGIESQMQDVPMWLPNGEEIKTLEEMAAMLNTDVKTASHFILNSKNAPLSIRLKASYEIKEIIKHVRTQAGQEKYKEPIGAVIKLDDSGHVIDDVAKPVEDVVKKFKKAVPKKKKGAKPKVDSIQKRRSEIIITRRPVDGQIKLRKLLNESFPPLQSEPIPLRPVPKLKMSQLGGRNWDSISPNEQERITSFYRDIQQGGGFGEPSKQLKANVQHNLTQRILDHSLTDPEFQKWSDVKIQSLFMSTDGMVPPFYAFFPRQNPTVGDTTTNAFKKIEKENKVMFLKELGIIPKDKTVNVNDKKDPYYKFYVNGDDEHFNEAEMFTKTVDREKLMRYNLLANLGLTTRFENRRREETGLHADPQYPGDGSSKQRVNELTDHSTHELLYLQMTRDTISQWAHTSADTEPASIAMQLDAKDLFGLHDSATEHFDSDITIFANNKDKMKKIADDRPFRNALLQAMYEDTQDFFKANRITHVELHRGMKFDDMSDAPDWVKTPEVQDEIANYEEQNKDEFSSKIQEYIDDNFNDEDFFQMTLERFEEQLTDDEYKKATMANPEYSDLMNKANELVGNNEFEQLSRIMSQANSIGDEVKQELYDKWHEENDKPNDPNSLFMQMKKEYENQLIKNAQDEYENDGSDAWANNRMADVPLDIRAQMQPISSWSLDPDEAKTFSGTRLGLVLRATIPVERILSTSFSGFGCLNEDEMVVLGGHIDTETRFRT